MSQSSVVLTELDAGKTIEARVGDRIELRLRENASTGHRWSFDDLDETVLQASEGAFTASTEAIGSGGDVRWILQARAPGTAQVKLKLWRRWEGEGSVQKRFAVTLKIRP
jgi:inhibitor of cysteine peptidase